MRIVGLLAWYDEPADMLYDSVASIAPHIDYLIAADGSYPYYPGGEPQSDDIQHEAIKEALHDNGVWWEIITPTRVWRDEVHKRTRLFDYAAARTEHGTDWLLVWDADFFCAMFDGVRERLAETLFDVATVELKSLPPSREPPILAHRLLYRANETIHCVNKHNVYACTEPGGNKKYLWGHPAMVPAADLTANLSILHDPGRRPDTRMGSRDAWHQAQGRLEAAR